MKSVLLFLIIPTVTFAQTNVNGFISSNTTWTLAGSPYIVTGNALVSHGYTLTVEPGVVVKFNTDKALQIDGELIAIGTPTSRITFTSNESIPAPGDWAKIHFPDTCKDAVFDFLGKYLSGSIMKYCDVLYGGGLGFGEIHIESSSPYFNNCNIMYSYDSGMYGNITTSSIDSCSFKNSNGFGVSLSNISLNTSDVYLRCNIIDNNNGGGVNLGPNGGFASYYLKVISNQFSANNGLGALVFSGVSHPNVVVEDNLFVSNTVSAVISGDYLINNWIRCNKFINNSGQVLKLVGGYWYEGSISNNLFEGNSSPGDIISIKNTAAYAATYFENNVIRNNIASKNCFKLIPAINDLQYTHITKNEFLNNIAQKILFIDPIQPESGSFSFLYMKHNNFSNPNAEYEIYNNISYGSANVNIDSNYWGGLTSQQIDTAIYDYFDFANQSVIYYLPILARPVVIDTACFSIVLPTAFNENELDNEETAPNIYPNPFSSFITFSSTNTAETVVSIFNFLGQQIMKQTFVNKTTINTEQFSKGMYFYELQHGSSLTRTGKIIKQ